MFLTKTSKKKKNYVCVNITNQRSLKGIIECPMFLTSIIEYEFLREKFAKTYKTHLQREIMTLFIYI